MATAVGSNAANPSYLPSLIANGSPIPLGAFAPNYQTPRSIQMNFGVQHEFRPGLVLTVDYVRQVGLHYLLGVDANHTGDVRFLNKPAALGAISLTNAEFGCGTGTDAASINCAIASPVVSPFSGLPGATIADFAGNGLSSPGDLGVGACALNVLPSQAAQGLTTTGIPCAFAGINPGVGSAPFLFPIGRSVYNAFDVKLQGNVTNPIWGIKHANFQFAYALSRFQNSGGGNTQSPAASDQDFVISAVDNRNALGFTGDSTLDRRHQFSFGGYGDLPRGFKLGTVLHFYSPLPATLTVPNTGLGPGEIFRTDFTGDGTVQDLLPGTTVGSFGRSISAGGLNAVLTNYNNTVAGNITPAGQALVSAGLFTAAQLQALGAVAPHVCLAPPVVDPNPNCTSPTLPGNEVGNAWLEALDLKFSYSHKIKEKVSIEPSVGFYNLFNFANFDPPSSPLNGLLGGSQGQVNGTTYGGQAANRIGVGTGTFALGAPRTLEFGLKLTF